jgi:hypothetical protein
MASGDVLLVFTPLHNEPPTSIFATLDVRNSIPVLDFDASTDEEAVFGGVLPDNYAGGGLTVTLVWMATSATSGNVVWAVQIERHSDDDIDLDSDSFAALNNGGQDVAPSASGEVSYDDVTFTNGADMDSLDKNESFRLKVRRDADNTAATDDMSGDAELMRVIVKET